MKILDCTLRDGGYYTNWDFGAGLVRDYLEGFNELPVDYLEIGYRSLPMRTYFGEFFYCPVHVLRETKQRSRKKIAIMLNEKDVRANDADTVLAPCIGLVDMVRLAVDPQNLTRVLPLAERTRKMGFEVGINVMYMSSWASRGKFLDELKGIDGLVDYVYMVDSYGGVYPDDVRRTFDLLRSRTNARIGFHGHNNLELALINTLTAIECGVEMVDATVTGMGRGAGNLKTELLLTALSAKGLLEFDFNSLTKVVDPFNKLMLQYEWGTSLPYMVSGANSLPQKDVMDWVSTRYYSFNSIIRALSNQSKGVKDNMQLPVINFQEQTGRRTEVLIVGGGPSAVSHSAALREFLREHPEMPVIHASSKNAMSFQEIDNPQFFCLVGNEGHRLEQVYSSSAISGCCILPPFPRKMGTYIPSVMLEKAYELKSITFTDKYADSHTSLALQSAMEFGAEKIYVAGYDGYSLGTISQREQDLFMENEYLFDATKTKGIACISITPTSYKKLLPVSIYSLIR